jgi:hypothetical protein
VVMEWAPHLHCRVFAAILPEQRASNSHNNRG